jgi:hypothetical protein
MKTNNVRPFFAAGTAAALLIFVPAVTECREQTPAPGPSAEGTDARGASHSEAKPFAVFSCTRQTQYRL